MLSKPGGGVLYHLVMWGCVPVLNGFLAQKFWELDVLFKKTSGIGSNFPKKFWECSSLG